MQLSAAPTKIPLPFAADGGKNAIPENSQVLVTPGAASLTDGFPPLTRTPVASGGIPPSGLDMNGILFLVSAISQWQNAGGSFPFDATFADDTNVNGYPKGAQILRSDGLGSWFNTVDNNTTNPETSASAAIAAGWLPSFTTGAAAVAMTNANVTLTPLQYGQPIIEITGTLTANLNLIFPAIVGEWIVMNNTTGAYTITAKTASGTGVTVSGVQGIAGDATNIYSVSAPQTQTPNVFTGGTTTGSANAQLIATTSPVATSFTNGQTVICTAGFTNTGSATFGAGGETAITIKKDSVGGLIVLVAGDIQSGDTLYLTKNTAGSCWVLGGGLALGSAAYFNVGTSANNLVQLNGSSQLPAVSGANLTGLFGSTSIAANGYVTLQNGLIMQWGTASAVASQNISTVNLPLTFPNNAFVGLATTNASTNIFGAVVQSLSTSQIVVRNCDSGGAHNITWFAIGN